MLSEEELSAVLLHEASHQHRRDNLKRLLMIALPDPLPFLSFAALLERNWKRLVEWAADDYAVARKAEHSVALAGALVRFARHQGPTLDCALATSLVENKSDLERRVERLLRAPQTRRSNAQTYAAAGVLAGGISTMLAGAVYFSDLPSMHRLLEILSS
jgi:Zn-dependent protease with chaperone function